MNIEAQNVHLFHIGYSDETVQLKEPGYALLDNRRNQRPDWYESWPIREFLLQNKLDEDAYYGFFSPKFHMKTGLDANEVKQFISTRNDRLVQDILDALEQDING